MKPEILLLIYLDYSLSNRLSYVSGLSVDLAAGDARQHMKEADVQVYPFLLSLGSFPPGEPVTVELSVLGQDLTVRNLTIKSEQEDKVREALAPLRDSTFDMSWSSSSSLRITGSAEKDGVLFISVPYDAGWHATVNGKPAAIQKIAGAFMGIETSAGNYDISLRYFPPGLEPGIWISFSCGASAILQAIVIRRRKQPDYSAS